MYSTGSCPIDTLFLMFLPNNSVLTREVSCCEREPHMPTEYLLPRIWVLSRGCSLQRVSFKRGGLYIGLTAPVNRTDPVAKTAVSKWTCTILLKPCFSSCSLPFSVCWSSSHARDAAGSGIIVTFADAGLWQWPWRSRSHTSGCCILQSAMQNTMYLICWWRFYPKLQMIAWKKINPTVTEFRAIIKLII